MTHSDTTSRRLNRQCAGRRNGWEMSQSIEWEKRFRQKEKLLRRGKNKRGLLRNELQFLDLKRQFGFFLSLFAGGDLFAQLARMRAIERLGDGFTDGRGLKIRCKHVGPRHGLKHGPMPACRAQQREDQQAMTKLFQHRVTLNKRLNPVK